MAVVAIGLELSASADMAAIAVAAIDSPGRYAVDVVFYGSPDEAAAEADKLYSSVDNHGVFLDPLPCSGIMDDLRARGTWLHELGPQDVSAAAWQYTTEVRHRRIRLGDHPALRAAMRVAEPRQMAVRWAFERKRVSADMSPLNAAAFSLWGLKRGEAVAEPSAWSL